MPNEISVYFRNDSNGDYHFIIKELANEFDGQFECLVEMSSVQIEKEVKVKNR